MAFLHHEHHREKVVQWLVHLASIVWVEEMVPRDWLEQVTNPLHKKGCLQDCDNYRGIMLLSVPGKELGRVVQRSLVERAEVILRENQCGFHNIGDVQTKFSLFG